MENLIHYLKLALEPRVINGDMEAEMQAAINEWYEMKNEIASLRRWQEAHDHEHSGFTPLD